MANGFPPANQRRLNTIISETYGGKYSDWYELALELYNAGGTYQSISERFAQLGVKVSIFTVRDWMQSRRAESAA